DPREAGDVRKVECQDAAVAPEASLLTAGQNVVYELPRHVPAERPQTRLHAVDGLRYHRDLADERPRRLLGPELEPADGFEVCGDLADRSTDPPPDHHAGDDRHPGQTEAHAQADPL